MMRASVAQAEEAPMDTRAAWLEAEHAMKCFLVATRQCFVELSGMRAEYNKAVVSPLHCGRLSCFHHKNLGSALKDAEVRWRYTPPPGDLSWLTAHIRSIALDPSWALLSKGVSSSPPQGPVPRVAGTFEENEFAPKASGDQSRFTVHQAPRPSLVLVGRLSAVRVFASLLESSLPSSSNEDRNLQLDLCQDHVYSNACVRPLVESGEPAIPPQAKDPDRVDYRVRSEGDLTVLHVRSGVEYTPLALVRFVLRHFAERDDAVEQFNLAQASYERWKLDDELLLRACASRLQSEAPAATVARVVQVIRANSSGVAEFTVLVDRRPVSVLGVAHCEFRVRAALADIERAAQTIAQANVLLQHAAKREREQAAVCHTHRSSKYASRVRAEYQAYVRKLVIQRGNLTQAIEEHKALLDQLELRRAEVHEARNAEEADRVLPRLLNTQSEDEDESGESRSRAHGAFSAVASLDLKRLSDKTRYVWQTPVSSAVRAPKRGDLVLAIRCPRRVARLYAPVHDHYAHPMVIPQNGLPNARRRDYGENKEEQAPRRVCTVETSPGKGAALALEVLDHSDFGLCPYSTAELRALLAESDASALLVEIRELLLRYAVPRVFVVGENLTPGFKLRLDPPQLPDPRMLRKIEACLCVHCEARPLGCTARDVQAFERAWNVRT